MFLGRTRTNLCPVATMLGYIDVRGLGPGPLFRFTAGAGLTRSRFVAQIQEALRTAGVDESRYNGHSFRIGAATTAAARGIEDCVIKMLGRWESTAYLQYVRIPRRELMGYSWLWGPQRMTVSRDCPLCQLVVLMLLLQLSWEEAGPRPILGQGCALQALLPPAALYGWHIREAYIPRGKRGRALPGTTVIPTLVAEAKSGHRGVRSRDPVSS